MVRGPHVCFQAQMAPVILSSALPRPTDTNQTLTVELFFRDRRPFQTSVLWAIRPKRAAPIAARNGRSRKVAPTSDGHTDGAFMGFRYLKDPGGNFLKHLLHAPFSRVLMFLLELFGDSVSPRPSSLSTGAAFWFLASNRSTTQVCQPYICFVVSFRLLQNDRRPNRPSQPTSSKPVVNVSSLLILRIARGLMCGNIARPNPPETTLYLPARRRSRHF